MSLSLERQHGWNSDVSVERVHLLYALGEAFMHCGDFIQERRPGLLTICLFLLHEFVRVRKGQQERPFEDRAVFFILNHRFEDALLVGQIFLKIADKKVRKPGESTYSLSEMIQFLSIWSHRARDDTIVGASHSGVLSKDVIKVITLRVIIQGLKALPGVLPPGHTVYP